MARLVAAGPAAQDPLTAKPAPPLPRQKQVRLRSDQVKHLIADYRAGSTVAALARRYGVNVATATSHLQRAGVTIRPTKKSITVADHVELLDLKGRGWNNVQIAQHFGCSRQAVQQALQRASRALKT